jgi:predicted RNA binding protein YcfA (HicA-like mRNA interferase family)
LSGKLPRLSGVDVVKILCNKFNFKIYNSKGSHLTLKNETVRPPILLQVIMHPEIKQGTLQGIVANSGIGRDAFIEAVNS